MKSNFSGQSASLMLKKGREKSLLRRHPWIFSGAVENIKGFEKNGQAITVYSASGEKLGIASVSVQSQIRARMWSFEETSINPDFFRERINQAHQFRLNQGITGSSNAFRIINSESDGLPGLIVDKYDNVLVCQFLSAGAEYYKEDIISALEDKFSPEAIYERSDTSARTREGLTLMKGMLKGKLPGELITIDENGSKFMVDVVQGHKTGFYLDQRDNRRIVKEMCQGMDVLNCFSYTGGFGISALSGGAGSVTNIDSSDPMVELSKKNATLNAIDESKIKYVVGDVFKELRTYRDTGRQFDSIVLDPPKFAESVSQINKAARGYKDINLLAMKLLRPGGLLFTFSCSGHIVPELFRKIVSDAAVDSGREVHLLKTLHQAADHAMLLTFPESLYLKGLMCRIGK